MATAGGATYQMMSKNALLARPANAPLKPTSCHSSESSPVLCQTAVLRAECFGRLASSQSFVVCPHKAVRGLRSSDFVSGQIQGASVGSRFVLRAAGRKGKDSSSAVPSGIRDELELLFQLLPTRIRAAVENHPQAELLLEIVLDLGRRPIARFPDGDWVISEDLVSGQDLEDAISKVGEFGDDNRAGINRTLHRISAIRNRAGRIVGLTCRVGRAISGSAEMVRDLVRNGGSLLLMGPPGVGKTTAIREISRLLADEYRRRVVIVDTSNEIAGDGDIPHRGIGAARRMQVAQVQLQHEVMIEAVENHMPQTIVIDEIGTELEAQAAATIAQRGVQLVGTAHGMTVDNLVKNPALEALAGGIQSVTLGDEEARRRGVQKSVLERKGPPVFSCAVEMISRDEWRVHHSLAATVDTLLAGKSPQVEIRRVDSVGKVSFLPGGSELRSFGADRGMGSDGESDSDEDLMDEDFAMGKTEGPVMVYPYQVSEDNLEQVLEVMNLYDRLIITSDVSEAHAVIALKTKLKQNLWLRNMAKLRQLPIYAIKSNTMAQMVRAVRAILSMDAPGGAPLFLGAASAAAAAAGAGATGATGNGGNGEEHGSDDEDGIISSKTNGSGSGSSKEGQSWSDIRSLKAETAAEGGADGSSSSSSSGGGGGGGRSSWMAVGSRSSFDDEIDALEEARLAIEQIVLPESQPVELLPRADHVRRLQEKLINGYGLPVVAVGASTASRLRILPAGMSGGEGVKGGSRMSKAGGQQREGVAQRAFVVAEAFEGEEWLDEQLGKPSEANLERSIPGVHDKQSLDVDIENVETAKESMLPMPALVIDRDMESEWEKFGELLDRVDWDRLDLGSDGEVSPTLDASCIIESSTNSGLSVDKLPRLEDVEL